MVVGPKFDNFRKNSGKSTRDSTEQGDQCASHGTEICGSQYKIKIVKKSQVNIRSKLWTEHSFRNNKI